MSLIAGVLHQIERLAINVFMAVLVSLLFILIGQPGVDWLSVSPLATTLNKVGIVVPLRAFFRARLRPNDPLA